MRLVIASLFAFLLLLAACGGDSTSSPTNEPNVTQEPAVSPGQLTPNPDACTADELVGALVSTTHSGNATLITLEVTNTKRPCVFDGPPEVRWYAADGTGLGVPYTPAAACASGATDFADCVYEGQVQLADPNSNDESVDHSVQAVVSVRDASALPCASPTKQAGKVGLQFPGVSLDVQVPLSQPLTFQLCSAQVALAGYGPTRSG